MSNGSYWIWGRCTDYPNEPVEKFTKTVTNAGFRTSKSGEEGAFSSYKSGRHDIVQDGRFNVQVVIHHIEEDNTGTLFFWDEDREIKLNIRDLYPDPDSEIPTFSITLDKYLINDTDIDRILLWIESISETFDVDYMLGGWDWKVADLSGPVAEELDSLPWLSVLSPETIADLGGREHVLETPAWRVVELETGHVVIVLSDNPYDQSETVRERSREHLFER